MLQIRPREPHHQGQGSDTSAGLRWCCHPPTQKLRTGFCLNFDDTIASLQRVRLPRLRHRRGAYREHLLEEVVKIVDRRQVIVMDIPPCCFIPKRYRQGSYLCDTLYISKENQMILYHWTSSSI